MSRWQDFLKSIDGKKEITLVGPCSGPPQPLITPIIYVDGGSRFRDTNASSAQPTIIVGDGDSSTISPDHELDRHKDFSDLAFVLSHLPKEVSLLSLWGFLGGRRDHELANFGEVHHFLSGQTLFARVDFHSPRGLEVMAFAKGEVSLDIEGVFSVFALEPTTVEIWGECRFPSKKGMVLPVLKSLGLSNEGSGQVHFRSLAPCFVMLARES